MSQTCGNGSQTKGQHLGNAMFSQNINARFPFLKTPSSRRRSVDVAPQRCPNVAPTLPRRRPSSCRLGLLHALRTLLWLPNPIDGAQLGPVITYEALPATPRPSSAVLLGLPVVPSALPVASRPSFVAPRRLPIALLGLLVAPLKLCAVPLRRHHTAIAPRYVRWGFPLCRSRSLSHCGFSPRHPRL